MLSELEMIQKMQTACEALEACASALDNEINAAEAKQSSVSRELKNRKADLKNLTDLGQDTTGGSDGDLGALLLEQMALSDRYKGLCGEKESLNFDSSVSEIRSLTAQIQSIEDDIDKIKKEISEANDALSGKKDEKRNLALRPEVEQFHFLQEEFDDLCKAVRNTMMIRYSQDMKENMIESNRSQCDRLCSELAAAIDSQTINEEVRHE